MKIRERDLGQLNFLAEGGFAKVYAVNYTLPGDPAPLAYKKFTVNHRQQAESAGKSVAFRQGLGSGDRADLDQFTTWPRALVTAGQGAISGLLMPLIPDDFFFHVPGASGQERKPREMQWLVSSGDQRTAARVDFGDIPRTDRLVLLAQLTYIIGRLHRHGWVFGDLSFGNAVFALDPPRTMLLDCDGAAARSDLQRKQSSTPLWDPPECPIQVPPGGRAQDLQDDVTDVYKLGLATLRCLTPGKGAGSSRNIARLGSELDAAGTALVARALSADRRNRPGASELYRYLRQQAVDRIVIPEVLDARLLTPTCPRGHDARIGWHFNHAQQINVRHGTDQCVTLDAAAHPDGYSFRPRASGPVSIEVVNRFGSRRVELGELRLVELPSFHLGPLPTIQVPVLDAIPVASLTALAPDRPAFPAVPALEMPAVDVTAMLSGPAVQAPLPPIGGVVQSAAETITSAILDQQDTFSAVLRQAMPAGMAGR